jgi:hypothetical protein
VPADRPKILYRVTAHYPPETGLRRFRRHFQSKAAAERTAARLRRGYSREGGGIDDHWYFSYPPTDRVTIEPSSPVVWPEPEEPESRA